MLTQYKNNPVPEIIHGWRAWIVRRRMVGFLFWQMLKINGNPILTIKEVKRLRALRKSIHGESVALKFIRSSKKYFWAAENSGFPSQNLKNFVKLEYSRNKQNHNPDISIIPQHTIIWGITNRCPLRCKHCYDWDNIDDKDHLSADQLKEVLSKIDQQGIRHVQLSGGEPLARFPDLINILESASDKIDFWLLTSGFGLSEEKALRMKEAGLLGVNISLDHWDESKHNDFRNNAKSFRWVLQAVENCRNAGIMVSLSLCATREFVTKENLENYGKLAKNIGAHFIRILEPRKVGRFSGQEVKLSEEQVKLLSEFTIRMNTHKELRDYPIIVFFGYHQRKLGCMGAGKRYLYIDAMGEFHACPFCQGSVGNILTGSFNEAITKLREKGCHAFEDY